jgi:hypothetical protein
VERKISGVGDNGTPSYRREWQQFFRVKRLDRWTYIEAITFNSVILPFSNRIPRCKPDVKERYARILMKRNSSLEKFCYHGLQNKGPSGEGLLSRPENPAE